MMRKYPVILLAALLLLTACTPGGNCAQTTAPVTSVPVTSQPATVPATAEPTTAEPTTAEPTTVEPTTAEPTTAEPTAVPTTAPPHSAFYLPDVPVEDVILYFNEVVLAAEFVDGGDPSLLQKWLEPISYTINGTPTEEDLEVLENFCAWLNRIEGFPGIGENDGNFPANLQIHFCAEDELVHVMGDHFYGSDGGVTFWYLDNVIYDATICCRSDIDQYTRNSVIMEEIYNGLGPVQDTGLRMDSLIYSGYSAPQEMTPMDELIIKLLYHPDMRCGMTAEECEAVIRDLYY